MYQDSGNSSSMQSNSSGGDDQEYDSTSFFHNTPPPPQTLFTPADPNFLQPFSDFINWPNSGSDDTYFPAAGAGASSSAAALPPPPPPPKNPKKRTRASRRAPTTVLTTDTSNFRAMVQEFTGIPAPPFAASAYSRLLGGQFRSAAQRQLPSQSYDIFSSSLLNMGGQRQLSGSGQQTGLPGLPAQPDPFFDFHSLLQQQHQPQQSNSSQLLGNAALEINIGDDGGNNNINSNDNNK